MQFSLSHWVTLGDTRQQDAYSQIDLDDLHDPEASAGIILEMQDRQRYFEGQMASAASAEDAARKASLVFSPFSLVSSFEFAMSPESGHTCHTTRNQGQSGRLGNKSCSSTPFHPPLCAWYRRLLQLKINKKSGDAALLSMTQNVSSRLEIKMKKSARYFSLWMHHLTNPCCCHQMTYHQRSSAK
jgi:transcription initiation factor TFIIH subunit 1